MCADTSGKKNRPRVGLLVTCLVDLFRPTVGFAAVKLIEEAGCDVEETAAQTCCGQPAYNSGDRKDARDIARQVITAFAPFDYVVAPSGSCAGQLRKHYPELLAGDPPWETRANEFAAKSYELVSFLTDVRGLTSVPATFEGTVTYHDSSSSLCDLVIRTQPRLLLKTAAGLKITELRDADVCCGFGGTFCVKYPDISNAIVERKTEAIAGTGAATLRGRQ